MFKANFFKKGKKPGFSFVSALFLEIPIAKISLNQPLEEFIGSKIVKICEFLHDFRLFLMKKLGGNVNLVSRAFFPGF